MNTIKAFTALTLVIVSPALSNARQPEVRNFRNPANSFYLIEPGVSLTKTVDAGFVGEAGDIRKLDRGSTSVAIEPAFKPSGVVDNLKIPAWMRGSDKGLVQNLSLPIYTPTFSENCRGVRYQPHPLLNMSQELRRQRYFQVMTAAACGAGVTVDLFDALIIQESRYNPLALSSKGASGLTQLMPGTARSLGVLDRWSISQNLSGGARYLRKQLERFGEWGLALGAYNAGPGNVAKYGGLPPFRETRGYVRAILSSVNAYHSGQRISKLPYVRRREPTLAAFN